MSTTQIAPQKGQENTQIPSLFAQRVEEYKAELKAKGRPEPPIELLEATVISTMAKNGDFKGTVSELKAILYPTKSAGAEASPKADKKPKNPKVPEGAPLRLSSPKNKKLRAELMKKDIKPLADQIVKMREGGMSIWDITCAIYGVNMDHADKKGTWLFYQKVNAILHEKQVKAPTVPVVSPMTTMAITSFLETHSEEELRALLVRTGGKAASS